MADDDYDKFIDETLGPMPPDTPERHRNKQDSADSQALSERWGEVARYVANETDMNAGETPSASYVEFLEDNIRDALEKEHELGRTTAIADFLARVEEPGARANDAAKKMREHVQRRGGPSMATGGVWNLMLEAADAIDGLISELRAIAGPAREERP